MKRKINLRDVKYMRYLDYRMNNVPKYMQKYSGRQYPRLVDYLFDVISAGKRYGPDQTRIKKRSLYRFLFKEGLFHSCQA